MHPIFSTLLLLALAFQTLNARAAQASSECLRAASDSDLLNELALRLRTVPGPGQPPLPPLPPAGPVLQASYRCVNGYYGSKLVVNLLDLGNGKETSLEYSTTDMSVCQAHAEILNRAKARIYAPTLLARCSNGYYGPKLLRTILKPDATAQDLSEQSASTLAECESTAKGINGSP